MVILTMTFSRDGKSNLNLNTARLLAIFEVIYEKINLKRFVFLLYFLMYMHLLCLQFWLNCFSLILNISYFL